MSTDIKLSKAQLAKIIQLGGFLGNMMGNFGKKTLIALFNWQKILYLN